MKASVVSLTIRLELFKLETSRLKRVRRIPLRLRSPEGFLGLKKLIDPATSQTSCKHPYASTPMSSGNVQCDHTMQKNAFFRLATSAGRNRLRIVSSDREEPE